MIGQQFSQLNIQTYKTNHYIKLS